MLHLSRWVLKQKGARKKRAYHQGLYKLISGLNTPYRGELAGLYNVAPWHAEDKTWKTSSPLRVFFHLRNASEEGRELLI